MYNPTSTRVFQHTIKILLSVLLFFTPLIFVTNTNELFEFPKMFFVYTIGTTIIFIFLIDKILNPKQIRLPNNFILLFVTSYVFSTIFSSHVYTSLWGYYTRFNGGLISILIYLGIYLVMLNINLTQTFIKHILNLITLTIIPIGTYATFQHYDFLAQILNIKTAQRVYSTIGQPNWLTAYVVMIIPIAIYELLLAKHQQQTKIFFIIIYVLGFSTIWFTFSLSGILSFILSCICFAFINKQKILKSTKTKELAILLILITILITITNPGIFHERVQDALIDIKRLITYKTHVFAQTERYNISDPGFIRMGLWKGTIHLVFSSKKILLIGTGPETFPYEFQKYRIPALNYSSEWDFILNKPHNYYLELASQIGLIGLISYMLLISFTLKKKDPILTTSFIAFYATNFFGWPTVSTNLLFWVWLAILDYKYEKN